MNAYLIELQLMSVTYKEFIVICETSAMAFTAGESYKQRLNLYNADVLIDDLGPVA